MIVANATTPPEQPGIELQPGPGDDDVWADEAAHAVDDCRAALVEHLSRTSARHWRTARVIDEETPRAQLAVDERRRPGLPISSSPSSYTRTSTGSRPSCRADRWRSARRTAAPCRRSPGVQVAAPHRRPEPDRPSSWRPRPVLDVVLHVEQGGGRTPGAELPREDVGRVAAAAGDEGAVGQPEPAEVPDEPGHCRPDVACVAAIPDTTSRNLAGHASGTGNRLTRRASLLPLRLQTSSGRQPRSLHDGGVTAAQDDRRVRSAPARQAIITVSVWREDPDDESSPLMARLLTSYAGGEPIRAGSACGVDDICDSVRAFLILHFS
jgi:hypothetical protein